MAWNQKCRGKSPPDSAAVLKLNSMFRNLLATRDEADTALDVLRSQDLPDGAIYRNRWAYGASRDDEGKGGHRTSKRQAP